MKRIIYLTLVIAVAISCSEDEKKVKCSFTFKEQTYKTSDSRCDAVDVDYMLWANGGDDWSLILDTSDHSIVFYDNVNSIIYGQTSSAVTRSGETLTFSGILENDDEPNDSGEITGECTCSN